ncbi:MAG TPA: tetratricopeptide repeat protein, partial [Burkholderiaceae bacterium]|nr:tetratricopeptide repeat protein [Burkholderiaceae bacterium]
VGAAALQAGKLDQALRHLREARLRAPGDMAVRYHLALALQQKGRQAEALQELLPLAEDGQPFHERSAAEALLAALRSGQR